MFNPRALVIAVFTAWLAVANAAALERRQIRTAAPDCTLARITILGALATTSLSIQQIADTSVKEAAAAGVQKASDALQATAMALMSEQTPPSDAKSTTSAGLKAAQDALNGAAAGTAAVEKAKQELAKAVEANADAANNC